MGQSLECWVGCWEQQALHGPLRRQFCCTLLTRRCKSEAMPVDLVPCAAGTAASALDPLALSDLSRNIRGIPAMAMKPAKCHPCLDALYGRCMLAESKDGISWKNAYLNHDPANWGHCVRCGWMG